MNVTEKKIVSKMIYIYCHAQHGSNHTLCESCLKLEEYASKRLSKCIYGNNKPTCQKCPVHCYSPDMKKRIKDVMRYAGPRMILHAPALSVYHLIKGFKKPPSK